MENRVRLSKEQSGTDKIVVEVLRYDRHSGKPKPQVVSVKISTGVLWQLPNGPRTTQLLLMKCVFVVGNKWTQNIFGNNLQMTKVTWNASIRKANHHWENTLSTCISEVATRNQARNHGLFDRKPGLAKVNANEITRQDNMTDRQKILESQRSNENEEGHTFWQNHKCHSSCH